MKSTRGVSGRPTLLAGIQMEGATLTRRPRQTSGLWSRLRESKGRNARQTSRWSGWWDARVEGQCPPPNPPPPAAAHFSSAVPNWKSDKYSWVGGLWWYVWLRVVLRLEPKITACAPCLPRNNASLLMSRAPRTHSAEALFNRRRKWRRDDRLREPFIGSSSLSQFLPFIQRDESRVKFCFVFFSTSVWKKLFCTSLYEQAALVTNWNHQNL